MTLKIAKRGAIDPFIAMEVLRAANELAESGRDVLHLEVGEPAAGAPGPVLRAAEEALQTAGLGYTEALGLPPLRNAIAKHYHATYGLSVSPDSVIVTTGASGAFLLSFLAAFDAGDRVALAYPGYPAYRNILQSLDVEVVPLMADQADHYQPSPRLLEAVDPVDGLILASPANPTGAMVSDSALLELCNYCSDKDIRLISDEIYHGITYDRPATSALSYSSDAFVINSFSKYFAMTGWRLGWMIVPSALMQSVERLAQNLFISPPTLPQLAALKAFECNELLEKHIETYRQNRSILLKELPKAGFDRLAPADGAFYIYADVAGLTADSRKLCREILEQTGVAITPGLDFDPVRGHNFVRISFAGPTAVIEEAAHRLIKWHDNHVINNELDTVSS